MMIVLLSGLSNCAPLPTSEQANSATTRPVPPLPFEKRFYRSVQDPAESQISVSGTPKSASLSPNTSNHRSAQDIVQLLEPAADKAMSAMNLAQSAQSPADWALVSDQWRSAIAQLVPLQQITAKGKSKSDRSYHTQISQKLTEYRHHLAEAQAQQRPPAVRLETAPIGRGIPLVVTSESSSSLQPSPTASPTVTATASPTASPAASPASSDPPTAIPGALPAASSSPNPSSPSN